MKYEPSILRELTLLTSPTVHSFTRSFIRHGRSLARGMFEYSDENKDMFQRRALSADPEAKTHSSRWRVKALWRALYPGCREAQS